MDYATGKPLTDPQGEKIRREQATEEAPSGVDITAESAPKAKAVEKAIKPKKMPCRPVVLRGKPTPVKKMPRRPVKIELAESSAGPKTRKVIKSTGKSTFKNRQAKARQRAAWEKVKAEAKAERSVPTPTFEVYDGPVKSFFNPKTGRRESVAVGQSTDAGVREPSLQEHRLRVLV